ncbi:MAG: glycosyltransferase [Chloroflexota bacterium]|nr:glycosyltransferase [Chloroflexota bacterium]
MPSDSAYLSVIVPCYNESENLQRGVLEEMAGYLDTRDYGYEVIISDDGSRDESQEIVRQRLQDKPHFRLLENEHGGKPHAVWQGIKAAKAEIILITDMDQSTPISELDQLLPLFGRGYDVVIGSRGAEREGFPLYRRMGSDVFRFFRRLFLLREIVDTQCGFKAMRTAVAREVFPRLEVIREPVSVKGWRVTAFDVELLFLAQRAGYEIAEVEVRWADRDVSREKERSYLAESKEMAMQVLRVKFNQWRGFYARND